ncbi:unnamed protein product, partial [Rotaria magnacalcarata]
MMSTIEGDKTILKTTNSDETDSRPTDARGDLEANGKIVFLLKAVGGAPILKRQ